MLKTPVGRRYEGMEKPVTRARIVCRITTRDATQRARQRTRCIIIVTRARRCVIVAHAAAARLPRSIVTLITLFILHLYNHHHAHAHTITNLSSYHLCIRKSIIIRRPWFSNHCVLSATIHCTVHVLCIMASVYHHGRRVARMIWQVIWRMRHGGMIMLI